jgi:hypothetical protein
MLTRLRPAPNDTLVREKEEEGRTLTFFFSDAVGGNGRCKQTEGGGGHASVRFPLNNFKFWQLLE